MQTLAEAVEDVPFCISSVELDVDVKEEKYGKMINSTE